ncbi:MAG: CBASS cGAMP synthase [Candidatus Thiodiazotropha sp. L084R]
MNNLTPLYCRRGELDRFINNITITPEQDKVLRDARKKIRIAIRAAFTEARQYLRTQLDITESDMELITKITPKFMTQGSYAYKTLNSPYYRSQEMDLDDGVYLPVSLLNSEPKQNKDWFFSIVDGALRKLAEEEGWEFTDKKDTCARVIIPQCQAHIDVPLYAVPDERHERMTEAAERSALKMSEFLHRGRFQDMSLYLLDSNQVYLATRGKGWMKSDPLLIAHWLKREIERKGERLRRVCRYLKAWRDFIWESGGPSSLTLMTLAAEAYPDDDHGRDDYALFKVVEMLPGRLLGTVNNPASPDETIYPRDGINREEISVMAQQLLNNLGSAMSGAHEKKNSIDLLVNRFGNRMPNRPQWIETISTAAAAASVRDTAAVQLKPNPIPNMRSG